MRTQAGFNILELLAVLAIIGILALIAYPNYIKYLVKGERVAMMTQMQGIASQIEAKKMATGGVSYKQGGSTRTIYEGFEGAYPKEGPAAYQLTVTPVPKISGYTLTATPIEGSKPHQLDDGALTLNQDGYKCRASQCGIGDEWNQ